MIKPGHICRSNSTAFLRTNRERSGGFSSRRLVDGQLMITLATRPRRRLSELDDAYVLCSNMVGWLHPRQMSYT